MKDRFENNKVIINAHGQTIFELPIMSKENCKELRAMLDEFTKHKSALDALGQPMIHWDTLLIYILSEKLGSVTRRAWETSGDSTKVPSLKEFIEFLANRCRVSETMVVNNKKANNAEKINKVSSHVGIAKSTKCFVCREDHATDKCPDLVKMQVDDRFRKIKALGLCLNCLKGKHFARECHGQRCSQCGGLHNKLLHKRKVTEETTGLPHIVQSTTAYF